MFDSLISLIAPHACLQCRAVGSLLCPACTVELIDDRMKVCLSCGMPCGDRGLCANCHSTLPIEKAILFGERSGVLEALVNEYKFSRKRSAYRHIADLLTAALPYRMPQDAVFIPLPTIQKHIRERGYDHVALVTRALARRHRVTSRSLITRKTSTVQHGASRRTRLKQSAEAFTVADRLEGPPLYILVDDIVTTGASIRTATTALKDAGAERIWVLILARQPLDEQR